MPALKIRVDHRVATEPTVRPALVFVSLHQPSEFSRAYSSQRLTDRTCVSLPALMPFASHVSPGDIYRTSGCAPSKKFIGSSVRVPLHLRYCGDNLSAVYSRLCLNDLLRTDYLTPGYLGEWAGVSHASELPDNHLSVDCLKPWRSWSLRLIIPVNRYS